LFSCPATESVFRSPNHCFIDYIRFRLYGHFIRRWSLFFMPTCQFTMFKPTSQMFIERVLHSFSLKTFSPDHRHIPAPTTYDCFA
jgi:hypothetical protein